jgi:hypothetical protein
MPSQESIEKYERLLKRHLTEKELKKLDEAEHWGEEVRIQFILIHRLNHYMFDTVLRVFDEMDKRKLCKHMAKRYYGLLSKIWDRYQDRMRSGTDKAVYYMMMDNFRLATDAVRPYIDAVVTATRDYLISLGIRDSLWIAEAEVARLVIFVVTNSYEKYFEDWKKECGIDFSCDFEYADMHEYAAIYRQYRGGLKLDVDIDIMRNNRCRSAWNRMMDAFRDDELMDKVAEHAIHLNPVIEERYHEELEKIEQERKDEMFVGLADKFKVSKLK